MFLGLKFEWWWGMAPMKNIVKKEMDVDRTLDNVGNGYRWCILGDLNGWIGNRTRAGITGAFGVPEENDNRRRLLCRKWTVCG